jgi:hypothetical protein
MTPAEYRIAAASGLALPDTAVARDAMS